MPIDHTKPESPGWWFKTLLDELNKRAPGYQAQADWYDGNPPPAYGPDNMKPVYRKFLRMARANWADLIVEAVRERMEVVGFKTGAEGDDLGDTVAWNMWQANQMDADNSLLLRAMLSMGDAYAIVGDVDSQTGVPTITAEDPRQVIAATDPVRRRRSIAALKIYQDEWTGQNHAYLYLPGSVLKAERDSFFHDSMMSVEGWEFTRAQDLPPALAGTVPVTRFRNRGDLTTGCGKSEFAHVTDDFHRINTMILQRVTVAIMQAFRQRAVQGVPTDGSDADFDWDDALRSDPGALWKLPEGVSLWESGGVDLTPILESVKADIRDVAARTRTPMFYLFPDAANGSAEGASLQREGLIFKTRDRLTQTAEPLEQVMSHAFLFAGDTERAARPDMEIIWAPPERFTLAERYDAASKASAAGVPWSTVMSEVLQFSPQQVARMSTERSVDALLTEPLVLTEQPALDG